MKYLPLILLMSCAATSSIGQKISLEYSFEGETFSLIEGGIYPTEHKPKVFSLKVPKSQLHSNVANVDIYRIMYRRDDLDKIVQDHYFKSLRIDSPLENGDFLVYENAIDISDLFALNRNRFLGTKGFKIDICLVGEVRYARIRNENDCKHFLSVQSNYDH